MEVGRWSKETRLSCGLEGHQQRQEGGRRKLGSAAGWCINSADRVKVSKETGSSGKLEGLTAKAETWLKETGFGLRVGKVVSKGRNTVEGN